MAVSKDDESKKQKVKDELQNLLASFDTSVIKDKDDKADVVDDQMFKLKKEDSMINFTELNPQLKTQAVSIMDAMYKMYLDMEIINNTKYLTLKKDLYSMDLTNIFFQLKTIKTVIETVAEEITAGNTHPRLIDSFCALQEKFSATIKSHANYLLHVEREVKAQVNAKAITQNSEETVVEDAQFYTTSDTKKLIDHINQSNPYKDKVIDAGSDLINPNAKEELMDKLNIDKKLVQPEKEEDDRGYNSILDLM